MTIHHGAIQISLVTARSELDQMNVPEDVPAVAVIRQPSNDIVLPVSLLKQIVDQAEKAISS